MANRSITIARAKKELAAWGMVISKRDTGEYRVNFKGGAEASAYYTDDIDDAVDTGVAMAKSQQDTRALSAQYRRNPVSVPYNWGLYVWRGDGQYQKSTPLKVYKPTAKAAAEKAAEAMNARGEHGGMVVVRRDYTTPAHLPTHYGKNPKPRRRRTRKNPPIMTGGKRKVYGSAAHMIGLRVYEIRYRHAADGKDYKHPFDSDDVMMLGMPDGSLKIESATGKKLWQNFDV